MPVRFEYFALQTRDGWYVLPKLGDTGNRYSRLFVQAERAGGGLLLRYKYDLATAGRFASTVEEGVIACEVVAGSVACTPKIAIALVQPAHGHVEAGLAAADRCLVGLHGVVRQRYDHD